jgi:hypothetical protein
MFEMPLDTELRVSGTFWKPDAQDRRFSGVKDGTFPNF